MKEELKTNKKAGEAYKVDKKVGEAYKIEKENKEKEFNLRKARKALKYLLLNEYRLEENIVNIILDLVITSDKEFIRRLKEEILYLDKEGEFIYCKKCRNLIFQKLNKLAGDKK